MTQKEILTRLIEIYSYAVKEVEKRSRVTAIQHYLYLNSLKLGICYCSTFQLHENIYEQKWIVDNCEKDSTRWCKYPVMCNTKKEILETLNFRLKTMKSILKKLK